MEPITGAQIRPSSKFHRGCSIRTRSPTSAHGVAAAVDIIGRGQRDAVAEAEVEIQIVHGERRSYLDAVPAQVFVDQRGMFGLGVDGLFDG